MDFTPATSAVYTVPVDLTEFLSELQQSPDYAGQVQHVREIPAREAAFGDLTHELHPSVQGILEALGISRLWSHQAKAIDAVLAGRHVAVVSSTASGKTLCYTVPLAQSLYERPTSRALLVYPTKALAQDQLRKLADFGAGTHFVADTYDGDTPTARRRRIKRETQVVLTNPDMLHVGILPYHHTWAEFFRNLRYVVLDEVHMYRGVFGSHAANVVRRLRRVAAHYGSYPQFVCCSATIGNPRELCETLTGLPFELVAEDGSPQGRRFLVLWNPPRLEKKTGRRRSTNLEAADLVVRLMRQSVRSICFTLARRQAELILTYVRKALTGSSLVEKVMAYRGGYLPGERREIERRLFEGELLAVTSTTALEVGVDIGGLDAAILAGYPGSVASTWQQAGRAGRGRQDALAVLMGMVGGIHQYLMQHPDYLLERSSEKAIIDPYNRFILAGHLLCAAYELALREEETELFGPQMEEILGILGEHGYVTKRSAWYWVAPDVYPAGEISIRSASGAGFDIVLRGKGEQRALLGTVDAASALSIVHEGAVYLHAGETYLVEELDLEGRVAYVRPARVDYYTVPMVASEVRSGEAQVSRRCPTGTEFCLGEMDVRSAVIGYTRRRQITEQELGRFELELPASSYETVGLWIKPCPEDLTMLQENGHDLLGSLHALEHAMIQLLPLFALCDPHDVGGVSHSQHPDVGGPAVFLYDGYPGGVGICESAFERVEELLRATAETISTCPCEDGCPSCVQAPDCGDGNQPLDKAGAAFLARLWSDGPPVTP